MAGLTFDLSLARSKVSIAAFSEERAPSGSDLVSILEDEGDHEEVVWRALPPMRMLLI